MNLPVDELHAWLTLTHRPGIGRTRARALLQIHGDPVSILEAPSSTLESQLGPDHAAALQAARAAAHDTAHAVQHWLDQSPLNRIICLGDSAYPSALLNSPDPPLMLYTAGNSSQLQHPAVALVGSRHATALGRATARRLATELHGAGFVVVSGLAVGIDAQAHEGVLDQLADETVQTGNAKASTIAVVACGLDMVYPRQHQPLFERLTAQGLVISEYPPGIPARPEQFPQRNRIIAGLCQAVVVVEAALRSGSLITARLALEAGREVLAVPGAISSPQAGGCHRLIKQGAGLCESAADILEALGHPTAADAVADADADADADAAADARATRRRPGGDVRAFMPDRPVQNRHPTRVSAGPGPAIETAQTQAGGPRSDPADDPHMATLNRLVDRTRAEPVLIDDLVEHLCLPVAQVQALLLQAEWTGRIGRLPGGWIQCCEQARK